MASTFFGLNIAYTGLQAAQVSINTTAHNISNVNSTGYSRQQASVTADNALRTYSYGTAGSGVIVNSIEQVRDSYYDVKYRNNETNYGYYSNMETYFGQIEDYLNEFTLDGFTESYEAFFESAIQLNEDPAEASKRNDFINKAKNLTDYFNTLSTNLQNIQKDANEEIKNTVEQINTISSSIAALNKQINMIEASKGSANDLRDTRNNLLDQLSEMVNVTTAESDMGNGVTALSVYINGQPLVDNYNSYKLVTEAKQTPRNASDAQGMYDISWEGGLGFDEYSTTLNGSLKLLLDVRDGNDEELEVQTTDADGNIVMGKVAQQAGNTKVKGIPYYQSKLNEFVQTFAIAVNKILTGTSTDPALTIDGNQGVPLFTSQYGAGTGLTASSITVNPDLLLDQSLLATTTDNVMGESYNDVIEDLIALRDKKMYGGGTGSYFLEGIVGDIAIDSSKATQFAANFKSLQTTIQNQRLSVMGVDEDEEGMDVMKYQEAYNLNAKMMSVMNEIYDKLINGTGV
jgi:flagellar hook-associated protein 1 FlgK